MIPALIGLRAAIDEALAALEPLAGVLTAWQAQGGTESAPAVAGPVVVATNGAALAGEPLAPTAAVSEPAPPAAAPGASSALRARPCRGCGEQFTPETPKARYCGDICKRAAAAARRRAKRNGSGKAPGARWGRRGTPDTTRGAIVA